MVAGVFKFGHRAFGVTHNLRPLNRCKIFKNSEFAGFGLSFGKLGDVPNRLKPVVGLRSTIIQRIAGGSLRF